MEGGRRSWLSEAIQSRPWAAWETVKPMATAMQTANAKI